MWFGINQKYNISHSNIFVPCHQQSGGYFFLSVKSPLYLFSRPFPCAENKAFHIAICKKIAVSAIIGDENAIYTHQIIASADAFLVSLSIFEHHGFHHTEGVVFVRKNKP